MASGDNPLPQMQLDLNQFPTGAFAPQPQPSPAPAPTPPAPSTATPPAPASDTASSLAPTGLGQSAYGPGGETLPAPYQGPAVRGGPVKNILTRMFYGMGQAAAVHVGLPTDYDIQKTTYNQAIQANDLALRQAQQQFQQTMVPYTLANGNTVYLTPTMAARVLPADISGQARLGAAQVSKELMVTPQGLYRTGLFSGQQPGIIPGTERGTYVDDALIAEYPQLGPLKGQFLKTPELMRAYGQGLQAAGTTSTTYDPVLQVTTVTHRYKNLPGNLPGAAAPAAAAPSVIAPAAPTSGALPEVPQPVQSPLLGPDGKPLPTQADVARWASSGIQYHGPVAPSAPAAAPTVPPAVTNRVPPGSPAGQAFAGSQAQVAAPVAGGVRIPPPPLGMPPIIWNMGVQMAEGNMDPSQVRAGKYGIAAENAAQIYSNQYLGHPFDAAQAALDFTYSRQASTQNTLKYLNSLTGPDNKSGNLQKLVDLSNSPALGRTQFPPINDVQAWARLRTGNAAQAAYAATILEVADQVGKILAGGSQGTSDKKLNEAQSLFQQGFNVDQIKSVASSLRDLLANRKTELIGNNRYLQRQFAQPGGAAAGAPGAPWGAQFGVQPR